MAHNRVGYDFLVKMIVIGDSGVGKTNIILNFSEEQFKENYVATIGVDFKNKIVLAGKRTLKLQIWDTAGQERYRTITETYYKGASGIVLAYAINDRSSFESMDRWMAQICDKAPANIKKIIVANKCDLEEERAISAEEGKQLAKKYSTKENPVGFMQISAKTSQNVSEAFIWLASGVKDELQRNLQTTPLIKIANNNKDTLQKQKCAC